MERKREEGRWLSLSWFSCRESLNEVRMAGAVPARKSRREEQ